MHTKDINWGSIIPLIGGLSLGTQQSLKKPPKVVLSYPAFETNDSQYLNYMEKKGEAVEYNIIDDETNTLSSDVDLSDIQVMTSLPPCAGLSMLNRNNRGGDAEQNDWMYKTTQFVMENIRPKVMFGENAPNLFTESGKKVQQELYNIADKYNYRVLLVKTDNYNHGTPQHRYRTFYFFVDDDQVPIYPYKFKQPPNLDQYLQDIPEDAPHHDVEEAEKKYQDHPQIQFFEQKFDDYRKVSRERNSIGLNPLMVDLGLMDEYYQWCLDQGYDKDDRRVRVVEKIKRKAEMGKGYWDDSPMTMFDATNAVISKNIRVLHPTKPRFLTKREYMRLMDLPDDFELVDEKRHFNTVCQNVITRTAEDMADFAKAIVKGKVEDWSNGKMVKQNLMNGSIEEMFIEEQITNVF